jgi:hypothetical protein
MSSPGARHSASRAKMPPPCASWATSPPALEFASLPHLPSIPYPIQVKYGRSHRCRAQRLDIQLRAPKCLRLVRFGLRAPALEFTPLPHLPSIPHSIQVKYSHVEPRGSTFNFARQNASAHYSNFSFLMIVFIYVYNIIVLIETNCLIVSAQSA